MNGSWVSENTAGTESTANLSIVRLAAEERLVCAGSPLLFHADVRNFGPNELSFDLEVWAPGVAQWLEISSCSTFTDYQARRLDGIPLAIELAAARVRSMPPEEIEKHLDERFRLLRGSKGFDERHRVLFDTLEWSYQHLEPELQDLLRDLSVFAGHFTAADVLGVIASESVDLLTVSDRLDELVDHSMVIVDVSADSAEYRLLDTVREFGDAVLGDGRAQLHAVHAQHFATLSRRLFDQMLSPGEAAAVQHRNRALLLLKQIHQALVGRVDRRRLFRIGPLPRGRRASRPKWCRTSACAT